MESDRLCLLRTIADNPADDFPRLAMADWLEEHGREPGDVEHAELIRVQVGIANLPSAKVQVAPGDPLFADLPIMSVRWQRLKARERELLHGNYFRWQHVQEGAVWDRGFVTKVTFGAGRCHDVAHNLSYFHPVHTIRLTNWNGVEKSLPPNPRESLPFLRRIELPSEAWSDFQGCGFVEIPNGGGSRVVDWGVMPGVEVILYPSRLVQRQLSRFAREFAMPPDDFSLDEVQAALMSLDAI